MKTSTALSAATTLIAALASAPALALGSFDAGGEGWGSEGNGALPSWHDAGFISLVDADNGWAYFRAPADYLVPVGVGGNFSFDLKHSPDNGSFPLQYGVRVGLQGAGLTLIAEASVPTTDWLHYSFSLDAAGGWRLHASLAQNYDAGNPAPSAAQFAAVLNNLSGVFIAADYTNGNLITNPPVTDLTYLDNVALVPEPGSSALLAAGLLTLLALRHRRPR